MESLASEGQHRREHQLQVINALEGNSQHSAGARPVGLDRVPRLFLAQVLIDQRRQAHRLGHCSLESRRSVKGTHRIEAGFDCRQHLAIPRRELTDRRDLPEVSVGVDQRAVDKIPPRADQFVVVAPHELRPGEVCVLRLGSRDGEVVAQRVRVVAGKEVADEDLMTSAVAELLAFHGQKLARDDVVGQIEVSGPKKDGRPDHSVEGDVVLAHEVVAPGVGALPPALPGLRIVVHLSPFDARGEVTDDRVKPHIQPLHLSVLPPRQGNRDSPVDVASDSAWLEIGDEVGRERPHVWAPVLLLGNPCPQLVREQRELEVEVLGLPEHGNLAVDLRVWVDQVRRVELVATVVALVAPGFLEPADGTGAFEIAVGKRATGAW